MNHWTTHAFAMLSPDAIRRGLAARIVDYFACAGLHPTCWALGEVTPVQADAMYGKAFARTEAYRYRCLDVLFALGPSLMLTLRAGEDGDGTTRSVHERALAVRGASTADQVQPGSIRHDLRALNRVMSLLHVSDGSAEAAAESEILVSRYDWTVGRAAAWRDARDLPDLLRVLAGGTPETRDITAIRRELRTAILVRAWTALDDRLRTTATRLAEDSASASVGDPELHKIFDVAHPAAAVLPLSFEQPVDLVDVERRLATVGIAFDDWQRAVLTTSMYFEPW
jgi:nucleoside diphosphate kinase